MKRVFADAYFFIAVLSSRDAAHGRAMELIGSAEVDELVTTAWVLAELADGMHRPGERNRCALFINDLRDDKRVRLLNAEPAIFWRGFDLYRERPDKEWSLTDCISFIVMKDEGLREALTGDRHFEQAGFVALLA